MPSFKILQMLSPETAYSPTTQQDPKSDDDIGNMRAAQQKYRTGMAPSGNPGQEAPLEQPWYSPDELVAGAMAPGVLRAGSSMVKAAPAILGNEGGWISAEAAKTALAKKLGLKEGDDLIKHGLQKVLENPHTASGLMEASKRPLITPQQIIEEKIAAIKGKGGNVLSRSRAEIEAQAQTPGTQALFDPTGKTPIISIPDDVKDPHSYLSKLFHESKHLDEHLIDPEKAASLPNYGVDAAPQKEMLRRMGLKGLTQQDLGAEFFDALENQNPVRAAQLNQAFKAGHWIDPKILDYEAQLPIDFLAKKSASTMEPHEFKILNNLYPKKK